MDKCFQRIIDTSILDKFKEKKIFKELGKLTGTNDLLQYSMFLEVYSGNDNFEDDFINWYKEKYKKDISDVNENNSDKANNIAKAVFDYYYIKHPSISSSVRYSDSNDFVERFGYSSIFDRELGKSHIGTLILDIFNKTQNEGLELKKDKYKDYLNRVKKTWLNFIFKSVAKRNGLDIEGIKIGYKNTQDPAAYIDSLLGGKEKSISDANLFAVYQELFASDITAKNYIDEVFCDTRLADVMHQIRNDLEAESARLAADANADEEGTNNAEANPEEDVDLDTSITVLNNHIGAYTSFMTHVGPRIRNYFNTLRKLASPKVGNLDTSNNYGIAETMDANACSSMLYNNGDFHNISTMIESIDRIGKTVSGFEAFVQLAEDLKNNKDFATEMFTVFAKTKMAKLETRVEDGKVTVTISNQRANPRSAFVFDLRNDIKSSFESTFDIMLGKVKQVSKLAETASKNIKDSTDKKLTEKGRKEAKEDAKKAFNKLKQEVIQLLKAYYPSIQDAAVISYIEINNNASGNLELQIANLRNLLKDVEDTIKATDITQRAYNNMLAKATEIREYNNKLKNDRRSSDWLDFSRLKDEREVYSDDYISAQEASIQSLVNKLLPYSIIDTNLNSRNIHGNNNSDVINNSLLTKLTKMLEDNYKEKVRDKNGKIGTRIRNKTLEAWGLKKLRSKQYKYSNILLEQPEIGNKGIFRYVDGQLCITEYAADLLAVRLFNGSASMDSGTNALYSEMTKGDYLPTSFVNFFKTFDRNIKTPIANYFLRTPSDAPKTFTIRAPRYSTDGLFIIEDQEAFNADVNEIIEAKVKSITLEEYINTYKKPNTNPSYSLWENENITSLVTPKYPITIQNYDSIKDINEPDENGTRMAYVNFATNDGILLVLKGRVEKSGKGHKLYDATLEAVVNQNLKDKTIKKYPDTVYNLLFNKWSNRLAKHDVTIREKTWTRPKRIIDRNHQVYKMLKNQFKQEMLDAAVAIGHYFELEQAEDGTYYVRLDEKDKYSPVRKNGISNTKGYKFYHLDENGKVLSKKGKGYTLGGAVFHSNKFTLAVTDEKGNIVKRNYLDKVVDNSTDSFDENKVNLLYGRASKLICSVNENGEIVVEDIDISAQNEAIENALDEYLTEYQRQAIEIVEEQKSFIKDVDVSEENITEYAINQLLMHFTFDELFEGSSKFYIDAQTILKRAKEVQGSGVPYGIADYTAEHVDDLQELDGKNGRPAAFLNTGTIKEEEKETVVNAKGKTVIRTKKNEDGTPKMKDVSIQDIFKGTMFEGTTLRRGFRGVTIKNSVRTNTKALNELVEKLVEQGLKREAAMDILFGPVERDKNGNIKLNEDGSQKRRGGFTETKVNDAQSYITVQEWVRRISARGQLQRYLPLIRKLIECEKNPNIQLTANEIEEFIQVQKNFYYDLYYDERYGIEVPRQIKNAEFVLVPQLIKGTQLEFVYNLMREANIDQLNTVETSKAANEEILSVWNNDGDIVPQTYTLDENGNAKWNKEFVDKVNQEGQIYSYNNLYTQQETPQHMNAENKAGIQIMKKIIDNLPNDDSSLGLLKKEFFRLFSSNIENSFSNLLDEFEIPRDENGNIELVQDETGQYHVKDLNLRVFLNKLKEELMRTGIDNNLMDYVTVPKDSSVPLMPAYMNNILTKFESVVQSLFNNNITRQKLPGFHSAQITNIGFKPLSDQIENVSYSKELKYHPDGKPYIEVMLPYSFLGIDKNSEHYKNMTDEQILKELQDSGNLDMIIGYRIPTEGKQSVCNMKVVGFVSDALGSTIVVPDDWVSQTGSDFDIDSVYGIQFETYKTKDGQVKKIEYKTKMDVYDWFNYIRRFSDRSLDPNVKGDIKEAKDAINKELNDIYETLHAEEEELYKKLSDEQKEIIKTVQDDISKKIKKQGLEGNEAYRFRLKELSRVLIKTIKSSKNKNSNFIKTLTELVEKFDEIERYLSNQASEYNERTKAKIDEILANRRSKFEDIAKKAGLMSLEEFTNSANIEKANGQKARNTRILEIMQEVLSDPATLEENLSRSNFDDLVYDRNQVMNENVKAAREARSPYNVFDQISYQEEAMSGAKLKAFSVTLDTFCSVCNTVRPILEEPVYVVYDVEDFDNPQEVMTRFNAGEYKAGSKTFAIRHNQYGWSNDNRNVVGKILTAYSSQTTAFILDAIKEGSMPNVNEYTFSTFKTLANIGCNYRTALSFIMQPGIDRIVRAHNAKKSVFSKKSGNEIHEAIKEIYEALPHTGEPINVKNTPITAILASLNKEYGKEFNKIFGQKGDETITISLEKDKLKDLPLIVSKLVNRLKNYNAQEQQSKEDLLFDLGVVLIFSKLQSTANSIGDIARCCNPDRFGAKQTVFATREVFSTIDKLIFNREEEPNAFDGKNEDGQRKTIVEVRKPILSVNGKNILEAIYPGVSKVSANIDEMIKNIATNNNIQDSAYPSLFAFLKYASVTSTIIAKTVFDTQDQNFVNLIKGFTNVLSGYNPTISEDTYNDLQKYVLSSLYNQVPAIRHLVKVRSVDGKIVISQEEINEDNDTELAKNETSRIYGYEHSNQIDIITREEYTNAEGKKRTRPVYTPFTIKDINNPTNEEMEIFEQLSPAQKVKWIKANFSDAGIFSFIHESLFNGKARGRYIGMQTLEYIEQNINSNIVYAEFRKAFFNNNPLIVSAAIDLVKYAVQVEGMCMSAKAINKVIDNDCLINEFGQNGLGFVDFIRQKMAEIKTSKGEFATTDKVEQLYENYLRSHPEVNGINTIYLTNTNIAKYGLDKRPYGMFFLEKPNNKKTAEANDKAFDTMLTNAGIKYYLPLTDQYVTNKYVRIKEKNKTTLYKIVDNKDYVILYPLSQLESNENSEWSSNESNNLGILSTRGYDIICNDYANSKRENAFAYKWISEQIKKHKEEGQGKYFFYKERKDYNRKVPALDFSIEELAKDGGTMYSLRESIRNHFSNPLNYNVPLFVKNRDIENYIFTPGAEFGSVQEITMPNRQKYKFSVIIPKDILKYEKHFLKKDKEGNFVDADTINSPSFKEIVRNSQGVTTKLNGVVQITPYVDNEAYAAADVELESLEGDVIDFAKSRRSAEGDNPSINYVEKMRSHGIQFASDITKEKRTIATRETAKYARHASDHIKKTFEQFIPDPENTDMYLPITDDRVIGAIKEDSLLLDRYMQAVNMAQGFINKLSHFTELNVESEDNDIKTFINDIKAAVDKVSRLPISDVLHRGNQAIADKISTNPLLKDGLIDVMDGYWKTHGSMWQFNDIMENGTPILQIILKDVMGDIDAKQKHFSSVSRVEYWNKIEEIKRKARERKEDIRFELLIDKDGRFIQDYDNAFIDKMNELRQIRDEEAQKEYGSIAHLKAKLAYDKFKAEHCNQPANKDYYIKKCQFEEYMLTQYPKLYSKYMKLYFERLEIYDYRSEDGISEEQQKRLNEIAQEMYNLYRPGVYEVNGHIVDRPIKEDNIVYSEDRQEELDIYGRGAADYLNRYIEAMRQLNNKYFEYDAAYGFEDMLKTNLRIIESFEKRVDGVPSVPQDVLDSNPQYVEAKNWIRNNARYIVVDEQKQPINTSEKFKKAFRTLALGSNGKNAVANKKMREHDNGNGINDGNGIPDARKLSSDEIKSIKEAQQDALQTRNLPEGTDRVLISNAKISKTFNKAFWSHIKVDGFDNPTYLAKVTEINKMLEPYVNSIDGQVHLELVPDTEEGIAFLTELGDKYQELRKMHKIVNAKELTDEEVEERDKWIGDNVELDILDNICAAQMMTVRSKSNEFKIAWSNVAFERKKRSGRIVTSKDRRFMQFNGCVPSRFLYGVIHPKGEPGDANYERFVDHEREAAINLINATYVKIPTTYYYQAMHEAMAKAEKDPSYDYMEWYNANHIYNPYTRKMQPLDCWMYSKVRDEQIQDGLYEGQWVPRSSQREKKIRDGIMRTTVGGEEITAYDPAKDMRNDKYEKDKGLVGNYIKGSNNGEYDSKIKLNESEIELRDYLQETLMQTANVESARRYFKNGYLPRRMKPEKASGKLFAKEVGKLIGIGISTENGNKPFYDEVGYENDVTPLMPMTDLLNNKQTIDISEKLKQLKDNEPTIEQFNHDLAAYQKALDDRQELINKYEEQLRKERQDLLDRDWLNVIDDYLEQAARYNAVQDNKQKLYFLLNTLRSMKMYSRKFGASGDLKSDERRSSEGKVYSKSIDKNLIEQYETWLRRILFDQWKETEGKATKIANALQGFASANYMMLNVRGGIANVTLGETGILAEAAAREYFNPKEWAFGTNEWLKGSISFARGGYEAMFNQNSRSYSKQDAIIKYMNVVDYDETTGVLRELSLAEASKKFRDAMFSPQTMGEHFMQNSVLFAMMKSHKLITLENGETTYMTKREYIEYKQSLLLNEVLDDNQMREFAQFKENLKKDENTIKDYAWFRRNALTDFIYLHCKNEQTKKFIKLRKEQQKKFEEEFEKEKSLYDQVELGSNGKMAFVEGSKLSELNKLPSDNKSSITKAEFLLGRFAEKTRKVNNKIHGVYNRMGAAYIERKWYGSLIMQYHKHLPVGLLKRYRARGQWNETRGSVDKGMVQSVFDLARLNFEKVKVEAGMTEEQLGALKGFIFLLTHSLDYAKWLGTTLDVIPAYERANILRNLGDTAGVVGAMMTVAALWAIADDDQEMQDSLWFNLALYEADRLATEAFMYNPIGAYSEGKKLWSTPIAAQSVITDIAASTVAIANYMLNDEYDPYYHSGRFAGEHKLSVYVQRRIPMWNGIRGILDTPSNNHYYKLGQNPIGMINIKKAVTGEE